MRRMTGRGAAGVCGGGALLGALLTSGVARSATLPNVNCQSHDYLYMEALPIGVSATTNAPYYQASVTDLLPKLVCSASDPNCDQAIYTFTSAYYESIPGADDYYYLIKDFDNQESGRFWMAVPIVDSQSDSRSPVPYYPSYPGLATVRFPYYEPSLYTWASASSAWPKSGGYPIGDWVNAKVLVGQRWQDVPFVLGATDYAALTNVMASPAASDSQVEAIDETCVVIVDGTGTVIDYAAHLAGWDPKPSCPACGN